MSSTSRLPDPTQDAYEWQYRGACSGADPRAFFSPETERGPRRRQREAIAKSLCQVCIVRTECLDHALAVREPFGVWGGLNTTERKHLLNSLQRKAG